jgi:hypothetical protein
MRRALALASLLAMLAGCASAPQEGAQLAVHDETIQPRAAIEVCYQLIFCPLVSTTELQH